MEKSHVYVPLILGPQRSYLVNKATLSTLTIFRSVLLRFRRGALSDANFLASLHRSRASTFTVSRLPCVAVLPPFASFSIFPNLVLRGHQSFIIWQFQR